MKISKITRKGVDELSRKQEAVIELDQKAGLFAALKDQIKQEGEQLDGLKSEVVEKLQGIGVRTANGSIEMETPRFFVQHQKRTGNSLDEKVLREFLDARPAMKARIIKQEVVEKIDEEELIRVRSEGLISDGDMRAFTVEKVTYALVIKDLKKGKT